MTVSIAGVALMFASGIVAPIECMPKWEAAIATAMPMYYVADAFKGAMIGTPAHFLRDALVILAWGCGALGVATFLLNKRQAVL
jgi:ABC-type polysaccharide/polyol phosphate export permease